MDEFELTQLVLRAQTGDRQAFGELARHFERTVFAIVFRRLRNASDAAELTQDVLIQAMRKLTQLRQPERFIGWLKQIAVRMSLNHLSRRAPELTGVSEFTDYGRTSGEMGNPLDNLLTGETAAHLRGTLNRLGDIDRKTLVAFYFEGHSLKQMSDEFDRPIGTIKRRLHTALNRLREQLLEPQRV
jgi:RNA polymerase sigma-70 factor (ECF subfamily)